MSFFAKMVFYREININKTTNSYHRCIDLILGFTTSLGFKPIDIWSSSYGQFSENTYLEESMATFVPKKMLLDRYKIVIKT